jgi:DNA-binding NarL/FixJ family response regulator
VLALDDSLRFRFRLVQADSCGRAAQCEIKSQPASCLDRSVTRLPQRDKKSTMAVRILLVDDHPIVRQGLRTLLEGRSGWEVIGEASDGIEALVKIDSLQPDIVVLDVTMPQMNGLEACRLIQQRRKNPNLEVLFVTQHDSPHMMREALDAGARGYVVKSNAARDLLEAVEAVSQHRSFTALAARPLNVPGVNSSQSKSISGAVTGRKDLP